MRLEGSQKRTGIQKVLALELGFFGFGICLGHLAMDIKLRRACAFSRLLKRGVEALVCWVWYVLSLPISALDEGAGLDRVLGILVLVED